LKTKGREKQKNKNKTAASRISGSGGFIFIFDIISRGVLPGSPGNTDLIRLLKGGECWISLLL